MKRKPLSKPSEQSSQKATETSQQTQRPYPTVEEYLAGIKRIEPVKIRGYKPIL